VSRIVEWRSDADKGRWLDGVCWIDARLPGVRAAAEEIGGAGDAWDRAARIVRWVRDEVGYRVDRWESGAQGERIADTSTMIQERYEDCDGKARAVVSLCRAIGIPARIVAVLEPDGFFSHAAADVDTGQGWDRAETIVEGAELGRDPRLRRLDDGSMPIV
jgi:transglutaminase-like putative cysteine protease